MTNTIAFKGFDQGLSCRGFQYEEGVTYEHEGPPVSLCNSGFHAVLLPLDAFRYYKPGVSEYRQVELDGVSDQESGEDSKIVGRRITVGASIGIPGFIRAHVEAVMTRAGEKTKGRTATTGTSAHAATTGTSAHAATTGYSAHAATTGYSANAATTGYSANAATTGDSAHAATTGYSANAATTGYSAHAATTGYSAHAATTGDSAHAATTGDYANAATTGYSANAATTGYSAHAATTGYYANAATTGYYANAATTGYSAHVRAEVKDEGSIAAVLGQGAAAGALGCWLVLTERDRELNIVGVQAVRVDGRKVKAGVFYRLEGGKVTEAEQEATHG